MLRLLGQLGALSAGQPAAQPPAVALVWSRLPFGEGVATFQEVWNRADPPPAITVHVVAGLGPGFLVEVDAVAVV